MFRTDVTKCSLCGREFYGYDNNGKPLVDGPVCDDCNPQVVAKRLDILWDRDSNSKEEKKSDVKNITLLKYKTKDNEYKFEVMDRFDCLDEVERLNRMILRSKELEAEGCETLWIKNTVII